MAKRDTESLSSGFNGNYNKQHSDKFEHVNFQKGKKLERAGQLQTELKVPTLFELTASAWRVLRDVLLRTSHPTWEE